ncbi:hypothetical protein GLX30_20315 [Streptomyces sp. Tu 2975]|nr:hypothetical protein GLX30_20315 [Streptomyces sp. Tu 2975]
MGTLEPGSRTAPPGVCGGTACGWGGAGGTGGGVGREGAGRWGVACGRPPPRRVSIMAVAEVGSHAEAVPLSSPPEEKRWGASWA